MVNAYLLLPIISNRLSIVEQFPPKIGKSGTWKMTLKCIQSRHLQSNNL